MREPSPYSGGGISNFKNTCVKNILCPHPIRRELHFSGGGGVGSTGDGGTEPLPLLRSAPNSTNSTSTQTAASHRISLIVSRLKWRRVGGWRHSFPPSLDPPPP